MRLRDRSSASVMAAGLGAGWETQEGPGVCTQVAESLGSTSGTDTTL